MRRTFCFPSAIFPCLEKYIHLEEQWHTPQLTIRGKTYFEMTWFPNRKEHARILMQNQNFNSGSKSLLNKVTARTRYIYRRSLGKGASLLKRVHRQLLRAVAKMIWTFCYGPAFARNMFFQTNQVKKKISASHPAASLIVRLAYHIILYCLNWQWNKNSLLCV